MRVTSFAVGSCLCIALCAAQGALAQSGLRLPERGEPGIDPAFARGWLAPDYDRFGFAYYTPNLWREAGFTPGSRMHWSYTFGVRGSLGMSLPNNTSLEPDRQVSLFGRYLIAPSWSLSAAMSRDTAGVRPPDFRLGVQRQF